MKNLISTLFLGGALFFNSYSQTTELEKYNQENKQLHEDFMKFCNENLNKEKYAESEYEIKLFNKNCAIEFSEDGYYLNINADTIEFLDIHGDGLDNKSSDLYTIWGKNFKFKESKYIHEISPEKQLSVAKQYTNLKRKILHDEKYFGY